MKSLPPTPTITSSQRGAAFLVMLVIMIVGISFFLISSLNKVTLHTARNEYSSEILSQTKETIIGYLLSGGAVHPPGMMMYPDVLDNPGAFEKRPDGTPGSNYDGEWESGCFNTSQPAPSYTPLTSAVGNMPSIRCLGRVPWRSLGMSISAPSENDPTGFMPWYAFSRNLIDSSQKLNSELLNSATRPWLKVYGMNGALLSDRVAFVIILPGAALPSQSRPPAPTLALPNQYLDKVSLPPGCIGAACTTTFNNADLSEQFVSGEEHRWMNDPANPGKQIEDPTYQFNDKLLYVTIDELIPLIEKRIARDVKACLDDYANPAINVGQKYPWATSFSNSTSYPRPGTNGVRFGRFPETVNVTSGGTPPTGALLTYIQAVQTALNAYLANPNATTLANLNNNGDTLKDNTTSGTDAHDAGVTADNCTGMSCTTTLQNQLDAAMNGGGTADTTMPSSWSSVPSCNQLIFTSSYWPDWRDLVFYQITEGYRPGVNGTFSPLQIAGSGNTNTGSGITYRAAVIIAGKKLGTQTRATPYTPPPDDYLSNSTSEQSADPGFVSNAHDNAGSSTSFITYKTSDPYYQSVNDLVICVDGKVNCQ